MKTVRRRGFTLLELLVSMAVLSVVLLLCSQILTQTTRLSGKESGRLASFSGAVGAFDRLAMDLARRIRGENTLTVTPDGKTLAFFAQVRNTEADSRISVVTYLVRNGKLLRQVEPVNWTSGASGPVPATDGEILSDEVFGLQFSFMRRDGRIYPGAGASLDQNGALIATLASIDARSRERFPDAESQLQDLSSTLTGVSESGSLQSPLFFWNAANPSAQDGLPALATYYERHYPLD